MTEFRVEIAFLHNGRTATESRVVKAENIVRAMEIAWQEFPQRNAGTPLCVTGAYDLRFAVVGIPLEAV